MHKEFRENYEEKLRLVVNSLIEDLEQKYKAMLAEHSAKGRLRSGDTIKRTMDFITDLNRIIYKETITHLSVLNLEFSNGLESTIQSIAQHSHLSYKKEALTYLENATTVGGKPQLYERMLPEVEATMSTHAAEFQNSLNAAVMQLKRNREMSTVIKALWATEATIAMVSLFTAGMWFKDPSGNYEPIIVGLGFVFTLIAIGIKIGAKKET